VIDHSEDKKVTNRYNSSMSYMNDVRRLLKLVKASRKMYAVAMKFIDQIKTRIRLVVAVVVVWATVVLGLLVYIAIRVH
jgi:uncharacterized membrane protein YkvA (DUF1232 family)